MAEYGKQAGIDAKAKAEKERLEKRKKDFETLQSIMPYGKEVKDPEVVAKEVAEAKRATYNAEVARLVEGLPPGSNLIIQPGDTPQMKEAKLVAASMYAGGPTPGYLERGKSAYLDSVRRSGITDALGRHAQGRDLMASGLSGLQGIDPNRQAELASQARMSELAYESQGNTSRQGVANQSRAVGGISGESGDSALKLASRIHAEVTGQMGSLANADLQRVGADRSQDIFRKQTGTAYENLGLASKSITDSSAASLAEYRTRQLAVADAQRRAEAGKNDLGFLDILLPVIGGGIGLWAGGPAGMAAGMAVGGGISKGVQHGVSADKQAAATGSTLEDVAAFRKKYGYG